MAPWPTNPFFVEPRPLTTAPIRAHDEKAKPLAMVNLVVEGEQVSTEQCESARQLIATLCKTDLSNVSSMVVTRQTNTFNVGMTIVRLVFCVATSPLPPRADGEDPFKEPYELCAVLRKALGMGNYPVEANAALEKLDWKGRKVWRKEAPEKTRFERDDLPYAGIKHIRTSPEMVKWIR